ncbi:MAG: response regulator [Candidatus Omnitrophica bacterium]|nr:response regulator [Candidatus Omnitrophota bacterium]
MEKVLYVDDEPEVRQIAQEILTKEGYEVILAKDGQEALELAMSQGPDLIILDYFMPPGLNGDEVCRQLKKQEETKSIPIIMVTAHPSEKEKSLGAGAIDFITKPVEKLDLLVRIRSALKIRHINNELQKIIAYIAELEKKIE